MKRAPHHKVRNLWLIPAISMLLPLAAVAQDAPSDEAIAQAVSRELAFSHSVPVEEIEIGVDEGVVSLDGVVPTLVARELAEAVAATVHGVAAIDNRLDVETPPIAAAELKMQIEDAIARNSATDAYEIDVETNDDGMVMLLGTVDSWTEKALAQTVAATVRGARLIRNEIIVDDSRFYRGAEEIRADIEGRFRWNAGVDESKIDILVQDGGRVTLSGTVDSLAEKNLVVTLAHVVGVKHVDAEHVDVAM